MQIVDARPPNFKDIAKKFPAARKPGTMFAYGDTLYAPGHGQIGGPIITDALMAHEMEHARRQMAAGVGIWWAQYLESCGFRFDEELLAHREEWRVIRETVSVRQHRRIHLKMIAARLSGPLYGNVVTFAEARRMIVGKAAD
jgi:hypothetical protein